MPRSTGPHIPPFLLDEIQREALSAELHELADALANPSRDGEGDYEPAELLPTERARVNRLRTWAETLDKFGVAE